MPTANQTSRVSQRKKDLKKMPKNLNLPGWKAKTSTGKKGRHTKGIVGNFEKGVSEKHTEE